MNRTRNFIVFDSNTLTYLFETIDPDYEPSDPPTGLDPEKISILRIFLYSASDFYIVPTVEDEYLEIKSDERKNGHISFVTSQILEVGILDEIQRDKRKDELLIYHNKGKNPEKDCRILAEAEMADKNVILTRDEKFINNLKDQTQVEILKASEYWERLKIPKGAKTIQTPRDTNPLSKKLWWQW